MTGNDPYVYPGTNILRNRFGITDAAALDKVERGFVTFRLEQGAPTGDFDLRHLRAIHGHLFQDIYDWAGQLRTVSLAKGDSHFLPASRIEMGMADVHRQLATAGFHCGLGKEAFAEGAARTIGDLNYVHPFREGNGRTQLEYLRQLAKQAGQDLDVSRLPKGGWIEASKAAHVGNYEPMAAQIRQTIRRRGRHTRS